MEKGIIVIMAVFATAVLAACSGAGAGNAGGGSTEFLTAVSGRSSALRSASASVTIGSGDSAEAEGRSHFLPSAIGIVCLGPLSPSIAAYLVVCGYPLQADMDQMKRG